MQCRHLVQCIGCWGGCRSESELAVDFNKGVAFMRTQCWVIHHHQTSLTFHRKIELWYFD